MNKAYLVEAYFADIDTNWISNIGLFDDILIAEKIKEKWYKFFEDNMLLFNEPDDFECEYDDAWTETPEFENSLINFGDILYFQKIIINEIPLNIDQLKENIYHKTDNLISLMKEFDRDYKIDNIIE